MKKDINQTDTTEIIRVVSEDFEKLGMQALPARPDMHSLEGLKKLLADRIAKMFDTNYEKLLNSLEHYYKAKLKHLLNKLDRNSHSNPPDVCIE